MSTVAFIGLGAMGSRMATNLHAAGHKLRVYNRDKAKTRPFADKGIEVCDSPAAAAKGAEFVEGVVEQRWGLSTTLKLPGGGELPLYEPRHPSPLIT